jgi:hypothetical protein
MPPFGTGFILPHMGRIAKSNVLSLPFLPALHGASGATRNENVPIGVLHYFEGMPELFVDVYL